MTWNHPRGIDPLVAHARQYEQHHGVRITWDARSLEDFEAAGLDTLAASYDLIVIDHPHVGMAAASGCLLPFDPSIHFDTVGRSHESYNYAGRQWALAIDAAAQVAARRAGSLTNWPQDWEEVFELCEERRVLCPLAPVHAMMCFYFFCDEGCAAEGDQLIDIVEGTEALERLREFASLVPKPCFKQNPIDAFEWMVDDERFIYCPIIYGYVTYARGGFRPTRIEFNDIPELRGSVLGGTGIAVSARSANAQEAIALALDLASPATQRGVYAAAGGQPAHADAWTDDAVNTASHDFFWNTRATLDGSWIRPRFDGYINFQEQAGRLVSSCLQGEVDSYACMRKINTLFAEAQRPK